MYLSTRRLGATLPLLALAAFSLLTPATVRAAGATTTTTLAYRATGTGCPSVSQFLSEVALRTPGAAVRPADANVDGDYGVELAEDGRSVGTDRALAGATSATARPPAHGRLVAHTGDTGAVLKEMSGPSCSDVASALALVLSLALDREREREAPPIDSIANPPTAPSTRPDANVGPSDQPPTQPSTAPLPSTLPARDTSNRWTSSVGLLGSVVSGYAPDPAWGASGFFELARPMATPWQIALRISASYVTSSALRESWGSADTTATTGSLELCPLGFASGAAADISADSTDTVHFEISPCVGATLGVLASQGHLTVGRSDSTSALYADARVALRPRIVLSRNWIVDIDAGVRFPFRKYDLQLSGPTELVYESPRAAVFGSVGLAFRFR